VIGSCLLERCRTGERALSLLALGRGVTCYLRPQTSSQRRVALAVQARRCSLSLGRRRSTRACFACAWCRDGYGRSVPCQRTLRRRDSPPLRHGRGATYQLRPPASCQRRVAHAAQARGRSLSLGTRRSTLACFACARCHDPAKERCAGETPPSLKRTSAVRRVSCGLQRQASAVCPTRRRRASARCVLEGGAALDLAARAPCCAGLGRCFLY